MSAPLQCTDSAGQKDGKSIHLIRSSALAPDDANKNSELARKALVQRHHSSTSKHLKIHLKATGLGFSCFGIVLIPEYGREQLQRCSAHLAGRGGL
jgi:hypothetical protein